MLRGLQYRDTIMLAKDGNSARALEASLRAAEGEPPAALIRFGHLLPEVTNLLAEVQDCDLLDASSELIRPIHAGRLEGRSPIASQYAPMASLRLPSSRLCQAVPKVLSYLLSCKSGSNFWWS